MTETAAAAPIETRDTKLEIIMGREALDKLADATVLVLGCGFGHKYLMENEYLRECVAQSGALITEFPPGFPASARTFPIRNRSIRYAFY